MYGCRHIGEWINIAHHSGGDLIASNADTTKAAHLTLIKVDVDAGVVELKYPHREKVGRRDKKNLYTFIYQ